MAKQPPRQDDWFEPVYIIGVGQYQRIGEPNDKTKMRQIGFVRKPLKPAPKQTRNIKSRP